MKKLLVGVVCLASVAGFAACSPDESKEDATVGQVDDSAVQIINNADKYPNISHRCLKSLGIYTTTRDGGDAVTFVGNDPNCPGYNPELPTEVGQ